MYVSSVQVSLLRTEHEKLIYIPDRSLFQLLCHVTNALLLEKLETNSFFEAVNEVKNNKPPADYQDSP